MGDVIKRTKRLEVKLFPHERDALDRFALANGYRTASDYVRATMIRDMQLTLIKGKEKK